MERLGHECVWVHQAAIPAEEKEPQAQGSPVHWWVDVFGKLRAASVNACGEEAFRRERGATA